MLGNMSGGGILRRRMIQEQGDIEMTKEWEEIADITASEDCIEIGALVDMDGKPFTLKKVIVSGIILPVGEMESNVAAKISTNSSGDIWQGSNHFLCALPKSTETKKTFCIIIEDVLGKIFVMNATEGYNATSVGNVNCYKTGYQSAGASLFGEDGLPAWDAPINAVRIGSYIKAIGAGSRMRVFGIRE